MTALHPTVARVTDRVIERSKPTRRRYLDLMAEQQESGISRPRLSCGNFAHGFAAAGEDKDAIRGLSGPNIAIVTAYNDMLSAHQPYGRYPEQIKIFAREAGATAQVAGGVPAMCDGVTQGQPGMDLSLLSRDVIALSTAIALSHGMFDAIALLGICDKIVPGLLIGALRFGHLPALLIPGGAMPSGLPHKENSASASCSPRARHPATSCSMPKLHPIQRRDVHVLRDPPFKQMKMELMGCPFRVRLHNPKTPCGSA